jgi:hypothetical protein
MEDSFAKQIDRLLQAVGRSFRGIRLKCNACGEEAFAASPGAAEMFGWSQVIHKQGALHEGLCIDCTKGGDS